MLSAARAPLRRLSPDESYEAVAKTEAILVDIRPESQRAIEGSIAGTAALQDLGLCRATDMVGGFHAWRAMGLPIVPPSEAS